ncbi:hypothetical protein [Pseudoalteromonas luteoviolacea]|uniref:Uncharacterized protein n=1 Tax=Pseudoalteromonas luteoviolacea S4054 TaxID=1129367 RepID=A0A0F6AE91_9GAMM|nr:hypothetical protein [Pseudoalteromonas luteoviolacea]AOT10613.1 hypothetical protein S4054249_22385 [Pseudoalteromonas luteoviolacea]AOT15319.1 hypothetical protein S40542_21210 [Pseudoalteromonas luteoviolacea]AOT20432.1 hypothetical protein S4054_22300 [Pseudoalteromonas luteoviolacea]KKE83709.1 hypothetical protein N479_12850 [Pseudoalteromonas luteoviolacea S4054]KZN71913.1 hypothetical protein N481_17215 [Pseudoalteromonas luteoviolacea S4047-1]
MKINKEYFIAADNKYIGQWFISLEDKLMDVFKPYMAPIVRLKVAHNGPFKIVGVLDNKAEKIKGKSQANGVDSELKHQRELPPDDDEENKNSSDDEKHLDTWA